jgi:uncharacterized protein YlxW (UPF0749 family)
MALLRDLLRDEAGAEYVEAAARRTDDGAEHPQRHPWLLATALAGLVGVLVLAVVQTDSPDVGAARDALVAQAVEADRRVSELESSVAASRAELAALQEELLAETAAGEQLAREVAELELLAGYVPVVGPGVVVTLDDAPDADRSDPAASGRVLDLDVQLAVDGLWEAGAEAVSVNDRRLTSTTAIRTAGAAILVDYRPLVPPYVIRAIGDPEQLEPRFAATADAGELASVSETYGLTFTTESADDLALPAATALLPVRARVPGPARAVEGGTP